MMQKPKIELWDTVGTGLVIQFPSGVIYTNQTGGTACLAPETEGVFVPFHNDYDMENRSFLGPQIDLLAYFEGPEWRGTGAIDGLRHEDADFIDDILRKYRHDQWFTVDRDRLDESHEAWVFVTIHADQGDCQTSVASGFGPYPRTGILTWQNSD